MRVLRAENLSKLYYLGDRLPNSLRDTITSFLRSARARDRQEKDTLWALKDVSFEVSDGETLGIIGSNGAGKSTLLKILSRITKPTSGRAEIRGRVGSLLEVGTGFHNELSGRENIYLNGAILGMKRAEINKKFDEIVDFSEIERFLDTPLKHYSSGMYMRLAFSVAAHLDPEVLIVDEVLAVGDIGFQKKCLGKMRDIGESGRTVLFVSHDMNAISRLCKRAIWLEHGEVKSDGEAADVVSNYLNEQTETGSERTWEDAAKAPGNEVAKLRKVRVLDHEKSPGSTFDIKQRIGIEMTFDVLSNDKVLVPNLHFYNEQGTCIFVSHDWNSKWRTSSRPAGRYKSTVWIPGNFLAEGTIFVTAALSTYKPLIVHFVERDAVTFRVVDSLDGDSARGDYSGVLPGVVRPVLEWENS
ncbi:MAG: ABC transporter ATP-binding protein [Acidobacteria bacterium]|nr:ABC transporter ATP-binding protein [Acidobacteriota bacterium]